MAAFQNTFRMFTPFMPQAAQNSTSAEAEAPSGQEKPAKDESELTDLKQQLAAMQKQLNDLADKD